MKREDFDLTNEELAKIKAIIQRHGSQYYEIEKEPVNDYAVIFQFSVLFDRLVAVSISGSAPIYLDDPV